MRIVTTFLARASALAIGLLAGLALAAEAAPATGSGDPTLDALLVIVKGFGGAVRAGEVFGAVVLGVMLLVLALRIFGKRIHDAIPDDTTNAFLRFVEAVLGFLFDSKPGGVLLNALTSVALSVSAVSASGTTLTPQVMLPMALGAGGVAGLATAAYGWVKDIIAWVKLRKVQQAEAAGKAAEAKVPDAKAAADVINKP
jgi:hypothetical protein